LGSEALNVALCVEDGRIEKSVIADLFYEKAQESVRSHLKTVYAKGKPYIASFAPMVFAALSQGDEAAERVLEKCVAEFEKLLWAVYRAWGENTCEITLFGGLTKQFSVIERFLSAEIKGKITFKMPKYPIIYGLMKDFVDDENFADTFHGEYGACIK
jgi:N-acetylglucosamine kinase-like BadF-type ATPase